jgi:hypothetical protein
MTKHKVNIHVAWETPIHKEVTLGAEDRWKSVAQFIFWALWRVMSGWFGLFIKSAALNWHSIDPNTTTLPRENSEISAIMGSWQKRK